MDADVVGAQMRCGVVGGSGTTNQILLPPNAQLSIGWYEVGTDKAAKKDRDGAGVEMGLKCGRI